MDSLLNLLSKNAIGLCITDESGVCIDVNEEFLKILGVEKKNVITYPFTSLASDKQSKKFNIFFEALKKSKDAFSEFNFQKKDGTFQLLSFSSEWADESSMQTLLYVTVKKISQANNCNYNYRIKKKAKEPIF